MNVVLVSHDAGGTIPPMLALAEEFVARGHRVVWLSQPSVRQRALTAGCEFVAIEGVEDYERGIAIEDQLEVAGALIAGHEVGEQLLDLVARSRADLVVIDANLAGVLAAAETIDAPSAVLLHSLHATFVETWFAHVWPLLAPFVNETRAHFGLDPRDSWAALFAGHRRLLSAAPRDFDGSAVEERVANLRHCGFLVPNVQPGPNPFRPEDTSRVLVGLSTTYQQQERLLQLILDALGSLDVHALASTSGQVDVESLRLPATVELHDFIDHGAVLPYVDVVVTHAGLGTIAAALTRGVPVVCAPIARDQHLNAARVAALGAGIDLGAQPTADDIAEAISTVLGDTSYRQTAARVGDVTGGASAVIDDLESLVQGTSGG